MAAGNGASTTGQAPDEPLTPPALDASHSGDSELEGNHGHSDPFAKLAVGAIGVVFGDIGTSPIYAFRETFAGHHPLAPDALHIYGVLSLVFWSMMLVVTIKYVTVIMRADNKGEGGSLALLALINRETGTTRRWSAPIILLGVFATALFYGDSMITPAVTVLGAVEGLTVLDARLAPMVIPLTAAIIVFLFFIQSRGTAKVGALFGPIMLVYFSVLAVLGIVHIIDYPSILAAINPWYALQFFITDKWLAFLALGSVVLAVTGAEALYADMGHFGRNPIRVGWMTFVLPALMLNYMGQGAMILSLPPAEALEAVRNPFFLLAPEQFLLPLVILATLAAIIASQAVISGAFSLTQQAIQLGFIPRLNIEHTSETAAGQIYIPSINWALMIAVLILVLMFQSSSNLAAAYGIAVTGAMTIDTFLLVVVLFNLWRWKWYYAAPLLAIFFIVDLAYLGANLTKVPDGGWVPLLIGGLIFTMLTTWARGRKLMRDRMEEGKMPISLFVTSAVGSATRVPGSAVFMTSTASGVPHALLHNLKHNKVLHERIILLTVQIKDVPYVDEPKKLLIEDLGEGFHRVIMRFGFMQSIDVPEEMGRIQCCGAPFRSIDTSYFLSRQTLIASNIPGMALWREKLFAWMLRNAASPMQFFRLPTNRVVELGSQVEI
jgi:KUP system potassium uptake protein